MRVTVYVPDELAETVRAKLPDLNVSGVLQEGLRARLGCRHPETVCAACAAPVDLAAHRVEGQRALVLDVFWRLEALMATATGGTVEGAARIVGDVAARHGVTGLHPPRRPRRRRRGTTAPVAPLPVEADSRRRHPTARPDELTA